jgi:hypothetical protein
MNSLHKLYQQHIKGTAEKDVIKDVTMLLCDLTNEVRTRGNFPGERVYITSRMLKHLYDSKPAEEFEFILEHLQEIVRYPDAIYKNKTGKRGEICFIKSINNKRYLCSIEKSRVYNSNSRVNFIATAFRIRKESYVKNFELIGSWKSDISSS